MKSKGAVTRLAAAAAVASMMLAGASVASASTTSTTTVPQGIDAASLPGSTVFGTTPPNKREQVSFVMQERNKGQLEASVEQGISQYLSVSQFAAQYGADPAVIQQLRSYLAGFGIKTNVYPDNVDVSATGTAGEFDKALSVTQHQYHVPAQRGHGDWGAEPAQTVHGTGQNPRMPSSFGQDILAVLGLTNYAPFTSQTAHAGTTSASASSSVSPSDASTSTQACEALSGLPSGCHVPSDFANEYGLNGLYADGASGQHQTLGIVTLAALDPGAPQYFWQNIAGIPNTGRTLTVQNIDGGPGAPSDASGSGETDIDTEQSGSLAPSANIDVYQAPNTDAGFADAFFTAASQNVADSVSVSWGESDTAIEAEVAMGEETPAYAAAFDEAFLELDAQGQSPFAATGDEGAYEAVADVGSTNLSAGNPADSPYVTAAGGTTLPWAGQATNPTTGESAYVSNPTQRAWGYDYLWSWFAQTTPGATEQSIATDPKFTYIAGSNGGFSSIEPEPSYQQGVSGIGTYAAVPWLTPIDDSDADGIELPTEFSFNPNPGVITGQGSGRETPDVSTDADPFSGYLLYEPSATTATPAAPALQGGWGGTSFVAPQLNGSTAVIDSVLGHRVGLWNPTLYQASTTPASATTPLDTQGTSNDNLYYTGQPGTVYNQATGLGVPNLTQVAQDLSAAEH